MNTKKAAVYETLKRQIISGDLKPGLILNEAELAQKLNVGKTPTREALIMLAHEGFIEALPRVGYAVTPMTLQDVLEIFALRILLEGEAIGLAAEKISENDLNRLKANNREEAHLYQEQNVAEAGLSRRGYQLNREFHRIIAQASGNQRLVRLIESLIDDLERALSFDPYITDPSQHSEIIRCLERHDRPRAQAVMRRHIEETLHRVTNRI